MEIHAWVTMISALSALFFAGANAAVFCIIKFNDLKHQEAALKRIEDKLVVIDGKVDGNTERIAKLEGKCQANHG